MKEILSDLFGKMTWKKIFLFVMIAIISTTMCFTDAPLWFYIIGIFIPMFVIWKFKLLKEFDNCKFLKDE